MLLRKDDPWSRNIDFPDVRNWRVVDADDHSIGFVESVVIDRSKNDVEAILTGANDRFPISAVEVGDHVIRVDGTFRGDETEDRPHETDQPTYRSAFRDHYRRNYEHHGAIFDQLEEAYRFGRRMALDAHFAGREFARAAEDLRAHWVGLHSGVPFEDVEAAVRFAYEIVLGSRPYGVSGLDRDNEQTLGMGGRNEGTSRRSGDHMSTGSPASNSKGRPESQSSL